MEQKARTPASVSGVPAAQPWRRRIRRIAVLPTVAAATVAAAAVAAGWAASALTGPDGWLLTSLGCLAAVVVFTRGYRLIRRACTAVGGALPPLLRHGSYPGLDAAQAQEVESVDELERALHTRMFAVTDLYPRQAANELIAALRHAVDNPEPLPDDLRAALDDLDDGARRWHDTLA